MLHRGSVTPYGDIDLGQYWLSLWIDAWRHQSITWTNAHLSSVSSHSIHHRASPYIDFKVPISEPRSNTHVPWCMSGPLTRDGGENVPGIPGACTTRNCTHLVGGPWLHVVHIDTVGNYINVKRYSKTNTRMLWNDFFWYHRGTVTSITLQLSVRHTNQIWCISRQAIFKHRSRNSI